MISIITATFNRSALLLRLYKSLINQTNKEFEWIIVDDGSTDDTKSVIDRFLRENRITVNYIYKENGGKHTALNIGIDNANKEFIFFVDSDDYLPSNSLEIITKNLNLIKKREDYDELSGICGDNGDINGNLIGDSSPNNVRMNYFDYRYKVRIRGDKSEIYKTQILKKNKFPTFEGEKFCPEALVWNRIALSYDMIFIREVIYYRDYQNNGLSSKIIEIRKSSRQATLLYYKELAANKNIPLYYRLRGILNYLRFSN